MNPDVRMAENGVGRSRKTATPLLISTSGAWVLVILAR